MTPNREKKIRQVIDNRRSAVVVLEDIHDPHNAGAVMRSCDAFGIYKICFIFEKEKRFNPRKVAKISSSSANKWLEFEFYSSTKDCLRKLKRQGYHLIATALDEKAKKLDKLKINKAKTAFLFGNEHRGLSDIALKLSNETVYIPMQGMVQSLNISVTAAIFLYEFYRQNIKKRAKNKGFLAKNDLTKLRKNWLK